VLSLTPRPLHSRDGLQSLSGRFGEDKNIMHLPHEGSYFLNPYKEFYKAFEYNLENRHN